jgi:hypothetical protein
MARAKGDGVSPKKRRPDGEGGMRVDSASDKPARKVGDGKPEPFWMNPRQPIPLIDRPAPKPVSPTKLMDDAIAAVGAPSIIMGGQTGTEYAVLLAAVILAQALDRHGEKMIQAAAVGRYRGA